MSLIENSLSVNFFCNSSGFINLFQSCVPIGSHLKIYSAPSIANKYDFGFLLIVEKKIIPSFFKSLEQIYIKNSTFSTCSITSIHKIISNFLLTISSGILFKY